MTAFTSKRLALAVLAGFAQLATPLTLARADVPKDLAASVGAALYDELVQRACWRDYSDMPEADRLVVEIKFTFKRGGGFADGPTLVSPAAVPTNDPPMQMFIQRAMAALNRCSPFQTIPAAYFDDPKPITATFAAKKLRR